MTGTEIVNGQGVRCYDNGGETCDRYCVVYMGDWWAERGGRVLFQSVSMSGEPFHPQGIAQHGGAVIGKRLGKRIPFAALPEDCQRVVVRDLTPEIQEAV